MKLPMIVSTMALSLALAGPTFAQTAPSDAGRLALAKQLVELSGGEKQAEATMKMEMDIVTGSVEKNLPPEASRLAKPIYDDMTAEMIKLTPQIIDTSTRLYAEAFTEKELRDWIAFQQSDTGRAIVEKTPLLRKRLLETTVPTVMQMVPELMRKASARVCEEQHCTAQERQSVAEAFSKAMPAKSN
jgi:hypothetical protein